MTTFEDFLRDCLYRAEDAHATPSIRVVPREDKETGEIHFYAHPQGISGETFDGKVEKFAVYRADQSFNLTQIGGQSEIRKVGFWKRWLSF